GSLCCPCVFSLCLVCIVAGWTVPRPDCRLPGRPTSDGCAHGGCLRGAGCHDKRDAAERRSLHSLLGLIQLGDGPVRGNRAHGGRVDAEEGELEPGAGLLYGSLARSGSVVHQPPPGDCVQTPRLSLTQRRLQESNFGPYRKGNLPSTSTRK